MPGIGFGRWKPTALKNARSVAVVFGSAKQTLKRAGSTVSSKASAAQKKPATGSCGNEAHFLRSGGRRRSHPRHLPDLLRLHKATAAERGSQRMTRGRLMLAEEVAELTGLSSETLAQWRSQKRGIPYLKIGRSVRYDAADVQMFLEGCRVSVSENGGRNERL